MFTLESISVERQQNICLSIASLDIAAHGIDIIIGANGAGKTLLLKVLAGLLKPSSGLLTHSILSEHMTFVPQQPVLLDRTAADNILLPLRYRKNSSRPHNAVNHQERTQQALAWAGITHLARNRATQLSTGQQQLVALARAWALSPQVLLLDEPCANLDPQHQQTVEALIQQLSHGGCKIIMSSHHMAQTQRLADTIVFLENGQLITQQSCARFFNKERLNTEFLNAEHQTDQHTSAAIQRFLRYC